MDYFCGCLNATFLDYLDAYISTHVVGPRLAILRLGLPRSIDMVSTVSKLYQTNASRTTANTSPIFKFVPLLPGNSTQMRCMPAPSRLCHAWATFPVLPHEALPIPPKLNWCWIDNNVGLPLTQRGLGFKSRKKSDLKWVNLRNFGQFGPGFTHLTSQNI